jgi:hypothetical protein
MLKKEHIKQAIEAIAGRNAEIGYALDEMLGMGRIHLASPDAEIPAGEDFLFIFDERPVAVKRVLFFNQGTVPIEERLLIKYGEMTMQHQLSQTGTPLNFREAAEATRAAGLRLLVNSEIDLALTQLQDRVGTKGVGPDWAADWRLRLEALRQEQAPLSFARICGESDDAETLFCGTVDAGLPACFVQFPFCMDTLMQAADINLEFFNIRFLLSCWVNGLEQNLFACAVNRKIEGIVYLTFKKSLFYKAMEIQYIATARGRPATSANPGHKELKGVGTFLMAGVWMLWKNQLPGIKDLLLDSEIGARRFYEGIGFESRGFSGFLLKEPRGRLVRSILEMAGHCPRLTELAIRHITRILKKQLSILRQQPKTPDAIQERKHALACVATALGADLNPAITRLVLEYLERYRQKIPEADEIVMARSHKRE